MSAFAERGAVQPFVLLLLGAIAAGGIAGGAFLVATGSDSSVAGIARDELVYYSCPNQGELGKVHRGDRILATARDASGDWLEIRDPHDLDRRVWVLTRFVVPDAKTDALPQSGCEDRGQVALGTPMTGAGTPPTTRAGTPPTSAGSSGGGGSTATTKTADTTPPTIGALSATPTPIMENGSTCAASPKTSLIRVAVSDAGGVAQVHISWVVKTTSGSAVASLVGGQYQIQLGPFPVGTNDPGTSAPVSLTVSARDAAGNTAPSTAPSSTLVLQDCFG